MINNTKNKFTTQQVGVTRDVLDLLYKRKTSIIFNVKEFSSFTAGKRKHPLTYSNCNKETRFI